MTNREFLYISDKVVDLKSKVIFDEEIKLDKFKKGDTLIYHDVNKTQTHFKVLSNPKKTIFKSLNDNNLNYMINITLI